MRKAFCFLVSSKSLVFLFLALIFLSVSSQVFSKANTSNDLRDEVMKLAQNEKNGKIIAKLSDAKLRSCQARENAIKKRESSLVKLVGNMEDKFASISARVENYYTTKLVPAGKTISNYDALVADIASKKSNVQTVLTSAQNDVASFSCTADDPKGDIQKFRVDMQNVKKALKDYRTSIKNLIVAVRSANGEKVEEVTPKP